MESIQLNNSRTLKEKLMDRVIILITWLSITSISILIAKTILTELMTLIA